MKLTNTLLRFFLFTVLTAISFFSANNILKSQPFEWQPAQKYTSGFVDKNPSFGNPELMFFNTYSWEFLIFERGSFLLNNRICVMKVGLNGPVDTVSYLTDNNSLNYHPSVSYDLPAGSEGGQINIALALWESYRNGKYDIYGSYYNQGNGWSSPFPFDTGAYNKSMPRSAYLNNSVFAVVYEKNNDIIYRHFNPVTQTVSYDTNLTAGDTSVCKNPFIGHHPFSGSRYSVSYEMKKADNKNAVYVRSTSGIPVWTSPDTIAYLGNNVNSGFVFANFGNYLSGVFNSDRAGSYGVYATSIYSSGGSNFQDRVISDAGSDNSSFHSIIFPVITANLPDNSLGINSINFQAAAHIKKSSDSVRVKFHTYNFIYQSDSSTAGNSAANVSLAMNRGIKLGSFDARIWAIYNKDSSSYSMLYGRYINIINTGIVKTESPVPQNFILHQNYPNPFNPVTKIRFGVPYNSFVTISVNDALGKNIETLVNENLNSGSYEVQFDGSKFAAGVYYCRLTSEGFSDVKKLILLK